MHDYRELGMADIIMILAVLVILTLIFKGKIVELAAWFYGSLYR